MNEATLLGVDQVDAGFERIDEVADTRATRAALLQDGFDGSQMIRACGGRAFGRTAHPPSDEVAKPLRLVGIPGEWGRAASNEFAATRRAWNGGDAPTLSRAEPSGQDRP